MQKFQINNTKKYLVLAILGVILLFSSGCDKSPLSTKLFPRTYQQILETNIQPAIDPTYEFPISYQYKNGCFAFAVNHILEYKYDEKIDLYEAEKIIEKPRDVLWNVKYIKQFLNEYEIEMHWYKDSETFFSLLQQGEPVVIQYPYEVNENLWIGHLVAAYSFDEDGVWVSDSLSGKHIKIEYPLVFGKSGKYTRYGFATVSHSNKRKS